MLRICAVLDILVLLALILDYKRRCDYLEELDAMKHKIWKLEHEVSEMGDRVASREHG